MLDSKFEIVSVCEPYHYGQIFLLYPAFNGKQELTVLSCRQMLLSIDLQCWPMKTFAEHWWELLCKAYNSNWHFGTLGFGDKK